ncbi:MAG: hypothetical protein ACXAEF_09825 [Candidatus Thorarchaeota archaeon]
MSDELTNNSIDIDKLERIIGNLRNAIVILIVVVSLLFAYIILQGFQQNPFSLWPNSFTIPFTIVLGTFLLCACLSANDKR